MSIHNSFWERQTESSLTSSENELAKINLNIKDLDDVQDYINDVNNYKSLVQRQNQGEDVKAELNQLGAKIKERQEFYKTEGKKSDTLVDLFFNPDKSSLGTEETLTNIMGLTSKEQKALDDSSWYDITAGAAALSSRIDKLLSSAGEGINKILPEFVTGNTRGEFTRRYIAGTDANDRSTDRFFNDHTSGSDINKLQQKVNNYREMYDRDRKEADLEVKKQLNYLQNGAWYFNPKNINPEYRRLLNEGDYGFFGFALPGNLPYSFAELGSSWGDITHMAGSLAVDAAIAQGTKFAIKKLNPYAAAATTTIDALAAVKNAQRGERIAENVNFLGGALATTSSVYFTKEMRRWETNSEAMDAYSNRVLNQAMNKGLDIDGILNRSNQYLNSIGIDTDGLDRIKQTQLALAYNSPTGDAEFEDLKHDARQGLSYLINANNALAFMDYIEALPFMNYTKSFLKDFGSKGFRRVKYTPNELRKMGEKQWIAEDRALREAMDPTIRGEFDRQIDRVAKKWISNPKTQLKFSRGSKFLTKKASELFPLMTKEGIEEGQQYLLQERYQRGEYDNEEQQESMFALPSVLNTAELAADAIAGYLGINFGDPNNGDDELRRAMEIGAMTAMWFRAPHMATNLLSNEMNERLNKYTLGLFGDTEHENVRNLIQQFKNDNVIGKVVAENYGRNQDDEHVGMFFDAFSKRGVNRDRLAESLEDFKRFKGPGVTDDYIDKDIKLLNTAWNVYNNPLTDSTLKDLNVKKDSSNHKQFVKLATRAIIDADDAGKILKEDAQKFQEQKNAFVNEALGILNELDFYDTVQDADKILGTHTYTESPNGKLAAIIRKISDTYDEVQKYNAKAYNEYTSGEKAKQDAIKALERQGVEKDVDVDGNKSYSDDVIADKIKEIADERFNQTREDFVREHIEDVFNYNYLKQARKLHSLFTNREKLLEYVQQELGTDINTERLSGMIHELNNSIHDYSNSVKSRTAKLNAIRKGLGLEEADEEQAINEFGIELPEETINQMGVLLVNNALYQTLNTAAEAYMLGKANPNNLRRTQRKPSWNQLTDEQKEYYINLYQSQKEEGEVTEKQAMAQYNKERREYKNKLHELQREYNQIISKNKGEQNIDADSENRLDEIEEEAAKLYIESELQTRIDRNTIAHKEAIEERPVLYDDISAAADGNKVAAKKVKQEVEKQAEEEKKVEEEQTLSPEEGEAAVDEQPEEEGQVNEVEESGTLDDNDTEEGTINEVHDRLDEGTIHPHISDAEKYLRDLYTFEDPDEAPRGKKQKTEEGTLNIDEQDSSDVANTFDEEGTLSNLDEESADLDRADRDFDGSVDGENIPNKPETVTDHKEVSFNYIDQTFFYMPEVKDEDTGEMVPNEVVPILQVGKDNPVKLLDGAQLKSPAELSKKLSQNGWFETTKKYYVIAADSGHVDMSDPDSLVVAMIIQDGKDAYATFMRSLVVKYKDEDLKLPLDDINGKLYGKRKIVEGLRHQFDLPQYRGGSKQAVKNRVDAQKEGRRRAFLNHNPEVINPTEEQVNNWYSKAPQDQRDDANDEVRRIMSGNNPIHTERHIRKQIQKLREARNQIINTCVQKGSDGNYIILTEGYKVVEPAEARISNGKINTQEEDGKHTFRSLTDGGFGMATDAQELTQQLNKDEVEIGVGVGMNAPEGEEYSIVHIDEGRQGSWDPHIGVGKAGKIYAIVQSPNGNKVPVMLREARLDNGNPDIQPDQVVEVIDENGNIEEGKTPTVAEFIFRILTHTFNAKQFGMKTPDPRLLDELLEILVNNGEHTIIDKKDQRKLQYFAKKQLWFDARNVLHIALPNEDGVWKLTKLTKSQLFDPNFKDKYGHTSEENRRKVIAAIAQNFHWNTERDVLSDNMVTSYPSLFGYLRTQFKNDESLKEFNFFGVDGLTFKKDEMFDENMKPKKFSHLAWMFTNKKLMTDVGDQVFKHPFVFGSGTKSVSPSEEARYQAAIAARENGADVKTSGSVDVKNIITENVKKEQENNSKVENIVKRITDYDGRQTGFTPAEFGQHLEEMIATPAEEARRILDEAGFEDAALLDVPVWYKTGEHISDEELRSEVEKAIERYVTNYNKTHDKKIKPSDFSLNTLERGNMTPIWRSEVLPMIGVKKDGRCIFSFADSMYIMNLGKKKNFATITGVYSSGKGGSGRINSTTARSWIKEAFGLTDDQIIITNAILKSTEDNKVFGVTQISADLINDEARVQFTLSRNAGHGIQFHEAFHYVNLLLHNKDKRQQIYDNYRKNHILRRNWSNERIEEALAEQFRRYAQMRTDRGILPSLKRMFNNFLDFAFQYRKRTLMRQIYDDILRGGYKGHILDKESVAEFKKAYPYGATSMNANIPNLRRDIAENFKAINTYSKFYQCAESLANAYIHFVLSQTVEDTIKAGSGSFESFLDDLRDRTEFGRSPYVQDILDNPIAFKYSILGVLKKYGIKGKTKSLKKYQEQLTQEKLGESLEQREGEDRYENTWDIDHFERKHLGY